MDHLGPDFVGLLGNPRGEQRGAAAAAHDQKVLGGNRRLGDLPHKVGVDPQMGPPLGDGLKGQQHPSHAHKEHLSGGEHRLQKLLHLLAVDALQRGAQLREHQLPALCKAHILAHCLSSSIFRRVRRYPSSAERYSLRSLALSSRFVLSIQVLPATKMSTSFR